jgi:transcriptional regulator with XRE-family HTH domain
MGVPVTWARPAFAAARMRLGMRQEDAAEAVGVSPSTWARWERGERDIRTRHRARLAEVFGVPLDEVDRWVNGCVEPSAFPWAGSWAGDVAATVEASGELWRWNVDPSRRRMLATLPWVPAFLSEWLLSWGLDPASESRAHAGAGTLVGMEDVHRVQATTQAFIQMDHQFGGGMVRPVIADYLHAQVSPLLRGTYSDEVGAALMSASATMTWVAGWVSYDLLQHEIARRAYGEAHLLATSSDDTELQAHVAVNMGTQATHGAGLPAGGTAKGHLREGLRLAELAAAVARHEPSPRLHAGVAIRQADAYAALGDTPGFRAAIGRARRELDRGAHPSDAPWTAFASHSSEVEACESNGYLHLGDPARAVALRQDFLDNPGLSPLSRTVGEGHLAKALLAAGDRTEAINVGRAILPELTAGKIASARPLVSLKAVRAAAEHDGDEEFCGHYDAAARALAKLTA